MKSLLALLLLCQAGLGLADADDSVRGARLREATVDYEAGPLFFLQNQGRYGASGTEFSADEVGQKDNLFLAQRASFELRFARRHALILLYAPLETVTRVTLDRDLQFRDVMFPAGTVVDHRYLFDGYRASYLYRLLPGRLALDLGASSQIRNASVAFTAVGGDLHRAENDIGVVFALKSRLTYRSDAGPYAMLDADALSTFGLVGETDGGIYDVALTLGLPVTGGLDLVLRARALGGGAEVPDRALENWAHFASFTAGLRADLRELF
jgi:hypothetical protein